MPDFLKGVDVQGILTLSNGLAFLAMLLAFWLINGIVKQNREGEKIPRGTIVLVSLYLVVSVLFVTVGTVMQILQWNGDAVDLNISSAQDLDSLKDMKLADKFKILIIHNGNSQDIIQKPYQVRLRGGKEDISLNADGLIWYINNRNLTIAQLTKQIEGMSKGKLGASDPAMDAGQ